MIFGKIHHCAKLSENLKLSLHVVTSKTSAIKFGARGLEKLHQGSHYYENQKPIKNFSQKMKQFRSINKGLIVHDMIISYFYYVAFIILFINVGLDYR